MSGTDDDFSAFVRASYARLARTAMLLTTDRGRAEDLVQAALVRTHQAWGRVDHPEAFTRTVMIRLAVRWGRTRWRSERPAPVTDTAGLGDSFAEIDLADAVVGALRQIGTEHRAVLVLRYWDQLSEREIAQVIGSSVGTVKSRAARGLAALRSSGLLDADRAPTDGGQP
jgi:RNA polymerase sigma-70 factor (sigma-E family)